MQNKNCIVYLVRSTKEDIEGLNKSLELISKNLLPFTKKVDILIFHEDSLEEFKSSIIKVPGIIFHKIQFNLPNYSEDIKAKIPEYYPHPTHGNGPIAWGHPGFTMGYRHMCRFFAGDIFNNDIIQQYDYYMRLDTDSFILSPLNFDIFDWAKDNKCFYGYIEPAVQYDNPKVAEGLSAKVREKYSNNIPEFLLYYTNFELVYIPWFRDSKYMEFYNYIDALGGIYTNRWGDHIIRFLGVNLFMNKENIIPVKGFTYQHGAVYNI